MSSSETRKWVSVFLFFAYTAAIVWLSFHHAFWRDEVRALDIARDAHSLRELFAGLRDEGHPPLWYLLLYFGYSIAPTVTVLPAISLLIASGGAAVLLARLPLGLTEKALILFGVIPIFEYSVMCRNYGISMLLIFLFASLYPQRFVRPLSVAFVLFLLANTNFHSALISLVALAALVLEFVWTPPAGQAWPARGPRERAGLIAAFFVSAIGIALAVALVLPDSNSLVASTGAVTVPRVWQALAHFLANPGRHLNDIFSAKYPWIGAAFFWIVTFALIDTPFLDFLFVGASFGLSLVFELIYGEGLRHEGLFLVLLCAVLAMRRSAYRLRLPSGLREFLNQFQEYGLASAFLGLLLWQLWPAYATITLELHTPRSAAPKFGELLAAHPEYRDAIILGEPDFRLDSLPFYAANRIYIPREQRFGSVVRFTKANDQWLSLGQLLGAAKGVALQNHVPVLIALGHFSLDAGPGFHTRAFSYQKMFSWTPEELDEFKRDTILVASFPFASSDEVYAVYLLKS